MSGANSSRVRENSIRMEAPLSRFLATLETTLSHKGRGEEDG